MLFSVSDFYDVHLIVFLWINLIILSNYTPAQLCFITAQALNDACAIKISVFFYYFLYGYRDHQKLVLNHQNTLYSDT